jgi:vacuolar-type H+-ATPase subunit D/Vma8
MHDLAIRLDTRASEAAELRTRLELTEKTQSTIEEERNRLAESLRQAEEQAEMLRKELEAERSKGFWQRLLGN